MQYKISNKVFPLDQNLDLALFSCITCKIMRLCIYVVMDTITKITKLSNCPIYCRSLAAFRWARFSSSCATCLSMRY